MNDETILEARDARLHVECLALDELADTYGTPLFVLSEARLRSNVRTFSRSLAEHWPGRGANVLPSIKANYVLAVRRILTQEGAGCDTFGPGELWAAARSGVPGRLISVNGTGKPRSLIRDAIAYGARITLDSRTEAGIVREEALQLGRRAHVRLRIRPDYTDLSQNSDFDPETTVCELATRYKPGIPREEAIEVGRELLEVPEVHLSGLMAHIGRHRSDTTFWRAAIRAMVAGMAELCQAWDWVPEEIDVGGGFATRSDPTSRLLPGQEDRPAAPTIAQYAELIAHTAATALAEHGIDPAPITLEVEPGRSMVADAGVHLAQVRNVKREGERTWVETDTTEMFLVDGVMEHNRFVPVLANRAAEGPVTSADVVGMSCQFDIIAPDAQLPEVRPGDLLAFPDTGAYLEASATNFNALPRPATVLVDGDRSDVVKRAESIEDVFSRDVVPIRLMTDAPVPVEAE